eukprot:9291191-Alexandrium_andersonii.AAC.1
MGTGCPRQTAGTSTRCGAPSCRTHTARPSTSASSRAPPSTRSRACCRTSPTSGTPMSWSP